MKQKSITLLIIVLTLGSLLPIMNSSSANNKDVIKPLDYGIKAEVGSLAPDFSFTEVDSGEVYHLSDFTGKMVLLNFFATWCPYCKEELPYIYELHMMYPEDMLQIISIDTDYSETESQVSKFKQQWNMDWLVGIDTDGTIADAYGVNGIPHTVLINETQYIVWEEIGFAPYMWPDMLETFRQYLPDDTVAPVINSFELSAEGELSIFNNYLNVLVNVTEDRNIKTSSIKYTLDDGEPKTISATPKKVGNFWLLNKTLELKDTDLYNANQVKVQVSFKDYFNNTAETEEQTFDVTKYTDSGDPIIDSLEAIATEIDESKFNLTVYASISEDLKITEVKVSLLKDGDVDRTFYLRELNETHWGASVTMSYDKGAPSDYTVKLEVTDVAGNTASKETEIAGTNGGGKASFSSFASISSLVLVTGVIFLSHRKRKH